MSLYIFVFILQNIVSNIWSLTENTSEFKLFMAPSSFVEAVDASR